MPRHDLDGSRSERSPRPDRPRSDRGPAGNVSEQVLRLREGDASYSAIARQLSLRRAVDAHKAFIQAVGARTGDEQRNLVAREQSRLDQLATRVRTRDAAEPEKMARRLEAVEKLRAALP
jgi:hypothetical protein